MGEYQIWVLVVVVVLSILDAVVKKAKKRGLGLPEGDEPSGAGAGEVEQERPRPVPGPDGAQRFPGPVAAPGPETARPGPRDSTRRGPQPRPQPSTAAPRSAGKRQSAFDILVPPEIRKELEDLVSGGKAETGRRPPSPTRASGPGEPTGSSAPGPPSFPVPGHAREASGGWDATPERDRAPRPVEVRSRTPTPDVRSRDSRLDATPRAAPGPAPQTSGDRLSPEPPPMLPGADYVPTPDARPPNANEMGFGTVAGLRRLVVAREVLGPPVALRDDGSEAIGR